MKHHERQAEEDDHEIPEREVGEQRVGDAPHVVVVTHDAHDRHVPDDAHAEEERGGDQDRVRPAGLCGERVERVPHEPAPGPRAERETRRGIGIVRQKIVIIVADIESKGGSVLLLLRHGRGQRLPRASALRGLAPLRPAGLCAPLPVVSGWTGGADGSVLGLFRYFPVTARTSPRRPNRPCIRA